jgi:hypothetical protein
MISGINVEDGHVLSTDLVARSQLVSLFSPLCILRSFVSFLMLCIVGMSSMKKSRCSGEFISTFP